MVTTTCIIITILAHNILDFNNSHIDHTIHCWDQDCWTCSWVKTKQLYSSDMPDACWCWSWSISTGTPGSPKLVSKQEPEQELASLGERHKQMLSKDRLNSKTKYCPETCDPARLSGQVRLTSGQGVVLGCSETGGWRGCLENCPFDHYHVCKNTFLPFLCPN